MNLYWLNQVYQALEMIETIGKFEIVAGGKVPTKGTSNSAGVDLYARDIEFDATSRQHTIYLGIKVELPENCVGFLLPRSSIIRKGLALANSVGVIDADYRGELKAVFNTVGSRSEYYEIGDKCCQLVIVPLADIKLVEGIVKDSGERGSGGFGSTGN